MNSNYWWEKKNETELYQAIHTYVSTLKSKQEYRSQDNLMFMRLYGNYDFSGLSVYGYNNESASTSNLPRLTLNVIESMISTVTAKITKNKPKPFYLTDKGNWILQQKAKKLNKFTEGLFFSTGLYRELAKAFTDSCVFGTGAVKFYIQNENIKVERIFIDEILIDDAEAIYGQPRQMHQTKYIHKEVLKRQFPSFILEIEDACSKDKGISLHEQNKDMIQVCESWHLPSGKGAKDGRHCITISTACIFAEKYDNDFFPFVFIRWQERSLGFFGKGITEQLLGIQLEINKLLKTVQQSMHLVSVPKLLVEASSKIVTSHLNNSIGTIIKYAGTPPSYAQLGKIPPELFDQLERLYQKAYEIIGVSQLSAQSQKPAGLDSGKALREFNDIETERFLDVGTRYEQAFLDSAKIMVYLVKDLYEQKGSFEIKLKGKKFLETIDWSDVDMEEDQYMMSCFPTSALSSLPSARFQEVTEWVQAGFVTQEDGKRLLEFPDLEAVTSLEQSGQEDIMATISKMIDSGEYEVPEPFQNLTYGIQKCQQTYLLLRSENAPEDRLELLRMWIEDAQALINQQMQAAQEQQAAMQPPVSEAPMEAPMEAPLDPMAVPEAAPVSDLLPV